jgi:hypothetical protein
MAHARREWLLSAPRSRKTGMNLLKSHICGKFESEVAQNAVFRELDYSMVNELEPRSFGPSS